MSEVSDLYQEVILDHNRRPRNRGRIDAPSSHAEGHNPLCGDQISLDLTISDGVVTDVRFDGIGCAISTASASMMTECIRGKSLAEVRALFEKVHAALSADGSLNEVAELYPEIQALEGVKDYPARVKCATLPWHTVIAALEGEELATTE